MTGFDWRNMPGWTWRDELRYRTTVRVRRWFRRQHVASWIATGAGLAFWACIVLAFALSAWWWLAAGAVWAAYLLLKIGGARDLLSDMLTDTLTRKPEPFNPEDFVEVTRPADPPASAARGAFWTGVGQPIETAAERERRERADYELTKQKLAGMRRHPAGGPDRPAS